VPPGIFSFLKKTQSANHDIVHFKNCKRELSHGQPVQVVPSVMRSWNIRTDRNLP